MEYKPDSQAQLEHMHRVLERQREEAGDEGDLSESPLFYEQFIPLESTQSMDY